MTLWGELEATCRQIKYDPEHVDLDQVRSLLRRCQALATTVEELLPGEVEVTLRVNVDDLALVRGLLRGDEV